MQVARILWYRPEIKETLNSRLSFWVNGRRVRERAPNVKYYLDNEGEVWDQF